VHSKWSWDEFLSCGDESIVYRVIKNLVRPVDKKEEKMFRKFSFGSEMYWYCLKGTKNDFFSIFKTAPVLFKSLKHLLFFFSLMVL
jgi:hypothetical protein